MVLEIWERREKCKQRSLYVFLKEQPERDLATKLPAFTCKYAATSMCVQYGNKTSKGIRPDPFISAMRTSFKRILDQIPPERIRLRCT